MRLAPHDYLPATKAAAFAAHVNAGSPRRTFLLHDGARRS
jgi:hypothetical protein